MDPVRRLTGAVVVFSLAALLGAGGGLLFILLGRHDLEAQSAYRSATICATAGDALAGRNCVAETSGSISRKYTDGAFPAADVDLSGTGTVVKATFPNSSVGKAAWAALPGDAPVPVLLWRSYIIKVDRISTIYDPDHLQNGGAEIGGVAVVAASIGLGVFAVVTILRERTRYQALAGRAGPR